MTQRLEIDRQCVPTPVFLALSLTSCLLPNRAARPSRRVGTPRSTSGPRNSRPSRASCSKSRPAPVGRTARPRLGREGTGWARTSVLEEASCGLEGVCLQSPYLYPPPRPLRFFRLLCSVTSSSQPSPSYQYPLSPTPCSQLRNLQYLRVESPASPVSTSLKLSPRRERQTPPETFLPNDVRAGCRRQAFVASQSPTTNAVQGTA